MRCRASYETRMSCVRQEEKFSKLLWTEAIDTGLILPIPDVEIIYNTLKCKIKRDRLKIDNSQIHLDLTDYEFT